MTDDDVTIIEQGSPEAQKIAKAMSSPTSVILYHKIADAPATASSLADSTGLPLSTVKYHLENLLDAGIIEIVNQKWSEKGRVMKIYGVRDRTVIFTPPQSKTAGSILKKYGVIAGGFAIGCSFAALFPRVIMERGETAVSSVLMTGDVMPLMGAAGTENMFSYELAAGSVAAPASLSKSALIMEPAVDAGLSLIQNCAGLVFLCALVVLAGLAVFEIVRSRRSVRRSS